MMTFLNRNETFSFLNSVKILVNNTMIVILNAIYNSLKFFLKSFKSHYYFHLLMTKLTLDFL